MVGLPGSGTVEVAAILNRSGVVPANRRVEAVGRQAIADPEARRRWPAGPVVWLDGTDATLAEQAEGFDIEALAQMRRQSLLDFTTIADLIVGVDDRTPAEVAEIVAGMTASWSPADRRRVLTETVTFDDGRSYPIHVGRGAARLVGESLPDGSERVAVVTQPGIGIEIDTGRQQQIFLLEPGEQSKQLEAVGQLASALASWGMTRADTIVSIGGGVVSDVAGFLAASYHRGIPVIHVSTTLLGQVDAAIGGKTGVNLPEGKNLFGAFWQPRAVVCEIDALQTLPRREFVSGMGELAKYHFIGGGHLDRLPLVDRVAAAARIKADVVSGDEREGGRRAILNYGHTLAHALETAGSYDLRHGEAVGIGLIYAAELAHRLGRIDRARVDEHHRVVAQYGLSTQLPTGYDLDELVMLFGRDKKAIGGTTFVLDGEHGVEPVIVDDHDLLRAVLVDMAGDHG